MAKKTKNKSSSSYSDSTYESTLESTCDELTCDDTETTCDESTYDGLFTVTTEDYYKELLKEEFKNTNDKEYQKLNKELNTICSQLNNNKVTMTKILKSNLGQVDKEYLIEMYGILREMDENSMAYIDLNKSLQTMIYTDNKKPLTKRINDEIKNLQNKLAAETPTLDKIMKANLSEQDKLQALELYQRFTQLTVNDLHSYDWFFIRKKIMTLLNKNVDHTPHLQLIEDTVKKCQPVTKNLKTQLLMLDTSIEIKSKLYRMYEDSISTTDCHEKNELQGKLKWLVSLPYQKLSTQLQSDHIEQYCYAVYNELNRDMYGMKEVKEKLMFYVYNRIKNPHSSAILCLKGPPGVGKTKLIQCLAKALNRYFDKISFGGAHDATILIGGNPIWRGSAPSMIIQILARAKCADPIILLDELDKTATTNKGLEVQHALLPILDPTQNHQCNDDFLNEFPHDYSHVWFIGTVNRDDQLDPALKDRLEIVNVPAYNKNQQVDIMIGYTLPNTCVKFGLNKDDIKIDDKACRVLLNFLSHDIKESGLRCVEKAIYDMVSKINFLTIPNYQNYNLSYQLSDFTSYPYTMTTKTVKKLIQTTHDDVSHRMIYV
ncbi:MAG TPA: AAA family ATPase [Candidatus Saccharimonadales bacterium]|nr:AAA family ATPase [Candidatus Saccharimonadales bacterium]